MTQLLFPGVFHTANAWDLSEDGKTAFLFDHVSRQVIKHKLNSDVKTTLTLRSTKYASSTWLCYCLFTWVETTETQSSHRIALLMFNQVTWKFKLVVFMAKRDSLKVLTAFPIDFTPVESSRLGYTAHKHQGKIEIIFYDRYLTRSVPYNDGKFAYIAIDRSSLRFLRRLKGQLPKDGFWEVPFISNMYLYFVSLKRREHKIACVLLELNNVQPSNWIVSPLQADAHTNQFPSQRATWCHSWELRVPFFAVAKSPSDTETQTVFLWSIDVISKQWQRHSEAVCVPLGASNFSIRAAENTVLLHCDINLECALYFAFDVTLAVSNPGHQTSQLSSILELDYPESFKNYADITCPICLETYTDPRTLYCGHSLCFTCFVRLRETSSKDVENMVKCPSCRKVTKIPECGLPTNYGLQKALEVMLKEQTIRYSPYKCSSCNVPGLCDSFWVCIQCQQVMPPKMVDTAVLTCPGCILKKHSGHSTKSYNEFKEYCNALVAFKADSSAKIERATIKVKEILEEKIKTTITDRLKLTANQIVDTFCAEKIAHTSEDIETQRQDVDKTLEGILLQVEATAAEALSKLLENSIIKANPVELTAAAPMSDEEIIQVLLKI